jgi:hypothetical protein
MITGLTIAIGVLANIVSGGLGMSVWVDEDVLDTYVQNKESAKHRPAR